MACRLRGRVPVLRRGVGRKLGGLGASVQALHPTWSGKLMTSLIAPGQRILGLSERRESILKPTRVAGGIAVKRKGVGRLRKAETSNSGTEHELGRKKQVA